MAQENAFLNPDRKMMALRALDRDTSIRQRGDCNWYISSSIVRVEGSCLSSGLVQAITPQAAIDYFWQWATEDGYHLRVNKANVRWNGFMWETVEC